MPGTFLQAEMVCYKLVLLKLNADFVDMICEINPELKTHVRYETTKYGKKIKVLYMNFINIIYGSIEAALQWHIMFAEKFKKLGYKLSPYDKFVANETINGKQCTIACILMMLLHHMWNKWY